MDRFYVKRVNGGWIQVEADSKSDALSQAQDQCPNEKFEKAITYNEYLKFGLQHFEKENLMEQKTIIIGENVYVDGSPLPNSYNELIIDPTWCDSKSVISPGLTLKNAIIKDVKMHAIAIVHSNLANGFIIAQQVVNANWDNWKKILC